MYIEIYQDANDSEPFQDWLDSIKDRRTLARIDNQLERVRGGNLSDCRSLGGGIYEQSSQARDVAKAKRFWKDYKDYKRGQT